MKISRKRIVSAKAVNETTFTSIDPSDVPDGVYIGEYDVNVIYAKVEVTVENGEITDINILEHRNEWGKAAKAVGGVSIFATPHVPPQSHS